MRKIILLTLIVITLNSCYVKWPSVNVDTVLDYSKFQKDGLFLTESNSVSFAYEPLGSVSSLQLDGYKDLNQAKKQAKSEYLNDVTISADQNGNWVIPTRASVLEALCKKAKELGANGIINIKITYHSILKDKYMFQIGYEATGMAIRK